MSKKHKTILIPGPKLIEMMLQAGLAMPMPQVVDMDHAEPEPEPDRVFKRDPKDNTLERCVQCGVQLEPSRIGKCDDCQDAAMHERLRRTNDILARVQKLVIELIDYAEADEEHALDNEAYATALLDRERQTRLRIVRSLLDDCGR